MQVKALELSDEQVHVLLAMRRLYLQNMGALQRRREELAALVVPVRALYTCWRNSVREKNFIRALISSLFVVNHLKHINDEVTSSTSTHTVHSHTDHANLVLKLHHLDAGGVLIREFMTSCQLRL